MIGWRVAAGALAMSLAVTAPAGCGRRSSHRASASERRFVADANASCARVAGQTAPRARTTAELADQLGQRAQALDDLQASFRQLHPPAGDERRLDALVGDVGDVAAALRRAQAAASNRDRRGYDAAVADGRRANARAGKVARELGLSRCLRPRPKK